MLLAHVYTLPCTPKHSGSRCARVRQCHCGQLSAPGEQKHAVLRQPDSCTNTSGQGDSHVTSFRRADLPWIDELCDLQPLPRSKAWVCIPEHRCIIDCSEVGLSETLGRANRVANAMFAAIHLNNLLGTDTPTEEVYLQCAMAFVLGTSSRMVFFSTFRPDRRVGNRMVLCFASATGWQPLGNDLHARGQQFARSALRLGASGGQGFSTTRSSGYNW